MFLNLVQSELLKMRKTYVWLLLFVSPLLAFVVGLASVQLDEATNDWITPLTIMTPVHTILFLPLLIGVFTSFICRYEHKDGGWKQLLSLPVQRTHVYMSKYFLVMVMIAANQILFMLGWVLVGLLSGITDPFPAGTMVKSLVGGWIATLPLAALMLLVSMAWSSFAAPLALNVVFTLPNILVANSETYAPYYPWVQPFLTMIPKGEGPWGGFFLSFESLIFPISGGFIVFFVSGLVYIRRKAV